MDFYIAYNMFRLAGILQGIVGRVRDGTASNEHAALMEDRVKPLSDVGWLYAKSRCGRLRHRAKHLRISGKQALYHHNCAAVFR